MPALHVGMPALCVYLVHTSHHCYLMEIDVVSVRFLRCVGGLFSYVKVACFER